MFKSKFLKNNAIFMAGTLISGLLGYAFHFVVSRQITVAQYGELQSLLSISIIFGVFNSALSYFVLKHTSVFAANRDFAANRRFAAYLIPKVSRLTLLILLALFLASPLLAHFLHFSSIFGFIVISIATFFSTLSVVYFEILRGWQKFFLISLIGIATALAKFVSGTFFAFLSHTTSAVSLSLLAAALVSWYLTKHAGRKTAGKNTSDEPADWREKYFSETSIRKSAMNIFSFSLALILVSNLDVLLVKHFSSAEAAGYYGAFALLGKIALWLNMPVVGVLLPEACSEGHLGKRPGKNLVQSYGLMTIIALGLMAAYYFVPNFVVNIFFGNKYIFDTQTLWLFALMSYLLSILTLEANLSFAKRDFRVIYLLAATAMMMVIGVAKYHTGLQEIVLAFSGSFLLGYIFILVLNLSKTRSLPLSKGELERDL